MERGGRGGEKEGGGAEREGGRREREEREREGGEWVMWHLNFAFIFAIFTTLYFVLAPRN
jgi:hypothetical protein